MTLRFSLPTMNTGLVATLLVSCVLGTSQAFQSTFAKTFGSVSGSGTVKTVQLLNQLCNESHDENTVERDACYGCFFRASSAAPGYPRLAAMSTCSDKYLNNTDYGHCRAYLRDATVPVDTKGTPITIYCTFLECVRQVNKDTLDSLKHVDHKVEGVSKKQKFAIKKKRHALATSKHLVGIKGICVVGPSRKSTNEIRSKPFKPYKSHKSYKPTEMQRRQWRNRRVFRRNFRRSFHRNFRQDSEMRSRSPRNVFQFFIDGREPSQAFRKYYGMHSRKNQMRHRKSHYRSFDPRRRRYIN